MKIIDRYSSAINSSNLKSETKTNLSDVDVITAAGMAAKYEPLGIALARMLAGGSRGDVVEILSCMAFERSFKIRTRITRVQSNDLAKAVLAWYRDGACQPCGGTGYELIPGVPSLSANQCKHCRGTGKLLFDQSFRPDWRELARYLAREIERTQAAAGVLAMRKISLDFQ